MVFESTVARVEIEVRSIEGMGAIILRFGEGSVEELAVFDSKNSFTLKRNFHRQICR